MAGVYIHIPYCSQACYYCNFHFSTQLKSSSKMLEAMCLEIEMRKNELPTELKTIYFGGGTPSILAVEQLQKLIEDVKIHFGAQGIQEITLECNPEDITELKLKDWKALGINRLSIGIQSFFDSDLKLMNRIHSAKEALLSLDLAMGHFENISVDLIYGIPNQSLAQWKQNITTITERKIPHISAYALTVEPNTPLDRFISKEIIPPISDTKAEGDFFELIELLEDEGYEHYETSNFAKPGFYSRNNTAYWTGEPYLGIGPSAHSFDGKIRSWNIRNNNKYIRSIIDGILPIEREQLSLRDKYNEYVMTSLRTKWGISMNHVTNRFGVHYRDYLLKMAQHHIEEGLLFCDAKKKTLSVTSRAKFLVDGLASDLFLIELKSSNS
tara:strand:+ start:9243 stop:10391 length:1149 start_codon:yes stop_codon:yes gene_type:complete